MKKFRYVGKKVPRIDALEKVTGKTKYSTDIYFPDMLWAKVLRSRYPHAKITKLDTKKAKRLKGVAAVLTAKDVPGLNGFGIINPNWPVLVEDTVKYMGDAIALVAAETKEIARKAVRLIEVRYKELPILDSTEKSLKKDAFKIHGKSNIMHSMKLKKGSINKGFNEADVIIKSNYSTQFMEHAYIETEGGAAVYDEKTGVLTIWCGNQYAFRDQLQVARSMNMDPEKIRIIGSPTGGAFGGKDEITVQIHLAMLAKYTKRPVRIMWERDESIITGAKRHAMKSYFKVGSKKNGELTAIDVKVVADTGCYDTIGRPILNLSLESSPGPYKYPHARFSGMSVYTNNAMGGEFRGFGAPQVVWGIEQEMDKLAEKLGIDRIDFRLKNALELGDLSAIDHKMITSVGIKKTLIAAKKYRLWRERKKIKSRLNKKNKNVKYGIGIASEWHAVGLGVGIPDFANVIIELKKDGNIILRTGAIEIGQGNLTAYAQILADNLNCDIEKIKVIHGDTFETPDSGTVTASRSILAVGNAVLDGAKKLKNKLIELASEELDIPASGIVYSTGRVKTKKNRKRSLTLKQLSNLAVKKRKPLKVTGTHVLKISEKDFGDGLPHCYYTYITQMALVGVDTGTGEVEVVKAVSFPEMGKAINIHGVEGQCEGGLVMGLGYTLYENVMLEKGRFLNPAFSTYILPTSMDIPEIDTVIIEDKEKTGPYGAKGVGEAPVVPISAAVMNAVYDAVKVRVTDLPVTPEKILKEIKKKK